MNSHGERGTTLEIKINYLAPVALATGSFYIQTSR